MTSRIASLICRVNRGQSHPERIGRDLKCPKAQHKLAPTMGSLSGLHSKKNDGTLITLSSQKKTSGKLKLDPYRKLIHLSFYIPIYSCTISYNIFQRPPVPFSLDLLLSEIHILAPWIDVISNIVLFNLFIQVAGRAVILFCMIEAEPRMHTKPVVFYLFFIWSLIEIFRYYLFS